MSELRDFQREVGEWGLATFPQSTPATILAHLAEEVRELEDAAGAACAEEAADVFLLLLHYCHRREIDLLREARAKLAVCRERTWARDEAAGYSRHVEER